MKFVFVEVSRYVNVDIFEETESQNKHTKELNVNENDKRHEGIQIIVSFHGSTSHGQ